MKLKYQNHALHLLYSNMDISDVDDASSLQSAFSQVKTTLNGEGLTVLINNAAIHPRMDLNDVTAEAMMDTYKTNVVGPLLVTKVKRLLKHTT